MNRNELVEYLRYLRDLEIAGYVVKTKKDQLNEYIREKEKTLKPISNNSGEYKWRMLCFGILAIILFAIAVGFHVWHKSYISGVYLGFFAYMMNLGKYFFVVVGVLTLIIAIVNMIRMITENVRVSNDKKQKAILAKELEPELQRCREKIDMYNGELRVLADVATELYAENVLPNPYRNLQSLYYIYDYMSSSQATLEETLTHEHMENGIMRIADKLDVIISQNQRILMSQRAVLLQNQHTNAQLHQIAHSASPAAGYARANAYFAQAQYLYQ